MARPGSTLPISITDPYREDEPEFTFDGEDTFLLSMAAGIERQNYASSWINDKIRGIEQPIFEKDLDYNPADDEANLNYDPKQVGKARSAAEANYIRTQIDNEYKQLQIIHAGSGGMVGEIYGGVFQPHVLVGGAVGRIGIGGVALLEGALEVGSEAMLHNRQRTRTMEESLFNVGAVTAGTLLIGVAGKGYVKGRIAWKKDTPAVDDLGAGDNFSGAAGAARAELSLEDAAVADGLDWLAIGPGVRLTRSQSGVARALSDDLADKGYFTEAMKKGETRGQTIESKINQSQGEVITVLDDVRAMHKRSGMDFKTFDEQVGIALSNNGKHVNPTVMEAADLLRTKILEPRRAALNELGLEIGEKPLGAKSYFPRIYNRQAIIDNYDKIKRDLVRMYTKEFGAGRTTVEKAVAESKARISGYGTKLKEMAAKLKKLEAEYAKIGKSMAAASGTAKAPKKIPKSMRDRSTSKMLEIRRAKTSVTRYNRLIKAATEAAKKTPAKGVKGVQAKAAAGVREQARISKEVAAEADRAAKDTIQNMLGGLPIGHGIGGATPSPIKARTVALTDRMLQDYRELSATNVMSKYTGSMDPYLLMRENFGEEMLGDKLKAVGKDYQDLMAAAPTGKARDKLRKQMASDIRDLEQLRDRLLHRVQRSVDPSSTVEKTVQWVKTINVATQLGGIALSSLPDVARPLMTYGFRSYIKGLYRGTQGYAKSLAGTPQAGLRRMGIASQRTLNSRLMDMADLGEASTKGTAYVQSKWGKWTGFDHWTDVMESIAAQSAMDWTLRMAKKVNSGALLSRTETMKVARMGFTEGDLKSFLRASERSGGANDPDLMFANTLDWGDVDLARLFESGIGSDVRRNIVRIGVGDKPILMDTNVYSLIFQYQSFALASTNRMLVAGLQQRDMALASGLLASIALGVTVGQTKSWLRGQDPGDWNEAETWREGLDRSGLLGVYNVGYNHIRNVAGDAPSRYAHRGPVSVLGGSTIGQLERIAMTGAKAQEGDFEGALQQAAGLTPNPMHLRELMLRLGEEM